MKRKNILSKVRLAIAEVTKRSSHDDYIVKNQWVFDFKNEDWEKLSQSLRNEFLELSEKIIKEFLTAENIKNFITDKEIENYIKNISIYESTHQSI